MDAPSSPHFIRLQGSTPLYST